jgi:hypothetical protein
VFSLGIVCGTGGTFWIIDFKNELVEHVTFADGLIHVNKNINVRACYLALASSGGTGLVNVR